MPRFENSRQLLRAIRGRLDEWVFEARTEAYAALFEGPDPKLDDDALAMLDRIDSRLSREAGDGLWGEDEYGIVEAGTMEEESTPHVVPTYVPQIPEYVHRGTAPVDEGTRSELNEALWEYSERVVEIVQERLDAFVRSSDVETWAE